MTRNQKLYIIHVLAVVHLTMITITKSAAEQIRKSAEQSDSGGMVLRLAATRDDDGGISYGMGFDNKGENDLSLSSQGIDVVISESYKDLLDGTTLDYVEFKPGKYHFIFINPNDPNHAPPQESPGPKRH